jgi:hypothetical protein
LATNSAPVALGLTPQADQRTVWPVLQLVRAIMVRIGGYVVLATLVATIAPALGQTPSCGEGSPDPISVKAWSATPAPEHDDNAVRIDYVLTNNLDVDIIDFRAAASYWVEGQEVLYHSVYNDAAPVLSAGGDVNGSVIALSAPSFLLDNPASVTVIGCTTLVVKADESMLEF